MASSTPQPFMRIDHDSASGARIVHTWFELDDKKFVVTKCVQGDEEITGDELVIRVAEACDGGVFDCIRGHVKAAPSLRFLVFQIVDGGGYEDNDPEKPPPTLFVVREAFAGEF